MPWWHGAWPPHHALVFLGVSDLVCPAWSCLAPSFVLALCLTLAAVSAGSWSPTGSQQAWMIVIVACWPAFSIRLWCLLGSVIFSSGWAVYLLHGWPWFWAFGLRCSLSSLAVLSLWCRCLLTVRIFPGCLPQLRGSGFIIQRYLVWDERHRVPGACLCHP